MRVGESKISKYGGVSEFAGRLSSFSGEFAATEASLDKNGSLGFIGGNGIFALLRELSAAQGLKLQRFIDCGEDEEQHEIEEAMGIRRAVAMGLFTHSFGLVCVGVGRNELNTLLDLRGCLANQVVKIILEVNDRGLLISFFHEI